MLRCTMEILQGLEKIVFLLMDRWSNAARNSIWLIFVPWNLNKNIFWWNYFQETSWRKNVEK